MNKKKLALILGGTALIALPIVSAQLGGPGDALSTVGNWLGSIGSLFEFSFLDTAAKKLGFLKFCMWLFIFILFFGAGQLVFGKIFEAGAAKRNAGIIAAIIATTTIILTPNSLIVTIFQTYATVVLVVIIMGVLLGLLYLAYFSLNDVLGETPWLLHTVRLIALIIAWIILENLVSFGQTDGLTKTITTTIILPLMIIHSKNNKKELSK